MYVLVRGFAVVFHRLRLLVVSVFMSVFVSLHGCGHDRAPGPWRRRGRGRGHVAMCVSVSVHGCGRGSVRFRVRDRCRGLGNGHCPDFSVEVVVSVTVTP